MADSTQYDAGKVASHTLALLRSLDKKVDLVLETQGRHTERLGRLERDLTEVKSDIALLENKVLSAPNRDPYDSPAP